MVLGPHLVAGAKLEVRSQSVTIGPDTDEFELEIVDRLSFRQITQQKLGTIVHIQSDNIEVAVVVEIGNCRRSRAQRLDEGNFSRPPRAVGMCGIRSGTIEDKGGFLGSPLTARLD